MNKFVKVMKPLVEKFPGLAQRYRYLRDAKALRKEPIYRKELGFKFNGPESMERGLFEPEETRIFEAAIRNFDVFVNIGANTGYYCLKALSRDKEVYAFEPNELNKRILLKNISSNNFEEKFNFFPIALSEKTGVMLMYGGSTGASLIKGWNGQLASTLVPVNTFDKVVGNQLDNKSCFVLIDIEGAELGCLQGARSLLENKNNMMFLVEIGVSQHQPNGIVINPNLLKTFEMFFDVGYLAYTANSALRDVGIDEIKKIESTHIDTLGTHNFIFIKPERSLSEFGLS